jgi:hypothetical protein
LKPFDLRRLTQREFGSLRGGAALPPPAPLPLKPGRYQLSWTELPARMGAIGVIGPALTDTLHPSFALHAMVLGSFCKEQWGPPVAPHTTRFEYPVLDDELIRLYIDMPPDPEDRTAVLTGFRVTLATMPAELTRESFQDALKNLTWLFGGPMPAPIVRRMQTESGSLATLAAGMAGREQWGDESFWATYRRRFDEAAGRDMPIWYGYFGDPRHVVEFTLTPEKPKAAQAR